MIDKKWVEEYKRKVVLEVQKKGTLENYLTWGQKIDFSSFESYINRNLVVDFRIKEYYDYEEVINTVISNIVNGIEHYCRKNGLFYPFFKELISFDERTFTLYIEGIYKDVYIKYELGRVYLNMKKSKFRTKRKMLDFPKFKMKDKNVILLADYLKSIINISLDNKVLEIENNIKNIDNLKKEYNSRKNKMKKLKIL